jgi:phosphate starvation-inducible PhoH-like protein
VLREFFPQKMINEYISSKQIEIVPLAFMRGRTFKNTFIIGDELQNTSNKQMLMLLTRLGEESKIVITGDISQSDNNENGLLDLLNRIQYKGYDEERLNKKSISLVKFSKDDIQRSKIVDTILDIYED